MSTIVVYESQTGFTAQYAQWIAEKLNCKCIPLKEALKENLSTYDQVIFGGWVMGNMICGLEKLLRAVPNPTAVFAVGATPAYKEVIAAIKEQNKLKEIPFFYMVGGFHFEKLGFLQKTMLKTLGKSMEKKQDRDRQGDFMAQMLGKSCDASGEEQTEELVSYVLR